MKFDIFRSLLFCSIMALRSMQQPRKASLRCTWQRSMETSKSLSCCCRRKHRLMLKAKTASHRCTLQVTTIIRTLLCSYLRREQVLTQQPRTVILRFTLRHVRTRWTLLLLSWNMARKPTLRAKLDSHHCIWARKKVILICQACFWSTRQTQINRPATD